MERIIRNPRFSPEIGCYTVPLTQGLTALIDVEDVNCISGFNWCAVRRRNTFYAQAWRFNKLVYMHHLLIDRGVLQVEHANRNGLDNRRKNLRLATVQENAFNCSKRKGTSSPYLGVTLDRRRNKWMAKIRIGGATKWLGYFDHANDAAIAYDQAAFSRSNFHNLNLWKE